MRLIYLCFQNNGTTVFLFSYKFNEIIPFDKWKTTILTKIKARIPEDGSNSNNVITDQDPLHKEDDDDNSEEL